MSAEPNTFHNNTMNGVGFSAEGASGQASCWENRLPACPRCLFRQNAMHCCTSEAGSLLAERTALNQKRVAVQVSRGASSLFVWHQWLGSKCKRAWAACPPHTCDAPAAPRRAPAASA